MMLKKIISIFALPFVICCSTNRENHALINDLLSDKKFNEVYNTNNKNNIIYIVDKHIPISVISNYSLNWEIINSLNPPYFGDKVTWNDSLNKIALSQQEISFFREQMLENQDSFWNQKQFNSEKIILIDSNKLYTENYKYSYKKLNLVIPIHNFTKPIFNSKKNIALIGFYIGTNSRTYSGTKICMLILKKEKGKWFYLGYETDIGIQN